MTGPTTRLLCRSCVQNHRALLHRALLQKSPIKETIFHTCKYSKMCVYSLMQLECHSISISLVSFQQNVAKEMVSFQQNVAKETYNDMPNNTPAVSLMCIQPIAIGVSFNYNLQSQSPWSLFNGMWQKRPREQDYRLRFEIQEVTLQMGCK